MHSDLMPNTPQLTLLYKKKHLICELAEKCFTKRMKAIFGADFPLFTLQYYCIANKYTHQLKCVSATKIAFGVNGLA